MSEPLSDNEKAATFIRWNKQLVRVGTAHQGWSVAPDMSKAENYIKALESLAETHLWEFCVDTSIESQGSFEVRIGRVGPDGFKVESDGESVSQAVTRALAALYDAEHPK